MQSMRPTVTVLDKRLRDGRHLVIEKYATTFGRITGSRLRALVDGQVVAASFTAPVRRDTSPVPGLPHTINLPNLAPGRGWAPVGLTEEEADRIEQADREWKERPARVAREAAPHAPTWELGWGPRYLAAGTVFRFGDQVLTVLCSTKRWISEDGRSFNLDAEEGYLYNSTVREATAEEAAELEAKESWERRLATAEHKVHRVFAWTTQRDEARPVDAEPVGTIPAGGVKVSIGYGESLTRVGDTIYSENIGGLWSGAYRQPATAERIQVFETLAASESL